MKSYIEQSNYILLVFVIVNVMHITIQHRDIVYIDDMIWFNIRFLYILMLLCEIVPISK